MEKWTPHKGAQWEFLENSAFECLFGGAAGPGKTDCLLMESLRQIKFPDYHALLLRRTYRELQMADSLIDRSQRWFPDYGGKYQGQQKRWTFPSGATIDFGHMEYEDSKYLYQTAQYAYIAFDELCTFTESQYLFLISRCRSPNPEIKKYVRAGTNPMGIGHAWVKARFIDIGEAKKTHEIKLLDGRIMTRCFIPGTVYDNPTLIENDPDYISRLMLLPEKIRRALLYGDWDVFIGQYFGEWDRSIHIVPLPTWEHYTEVISIDYGYSKPASVGWWKIGVDGKAVRYKELYQEKLTYTELGKEIVKRTPDISKIECIVGDPAMWGDRAHHKEALIGESGAETLQKVFDEAWGVAKVILIQGDNNRVTGWGRFREYLKPYKNQHEQMTSRFGVTANCLNFIRTVPGLIYSSTKPEDIDTKGEDHCADDSRYFFMSRPETPEIKETHIPTKTELHWKWAKEQATRKKEKKIIGM